MYAFWDMFRRQMEGENYRRRDHGERPLEDRDIYEALGAKRSTFSGWKNQGIMPDDYLPLEDVIVDLLHGKREVWHARCKDAHRAHKAARTRHRPADVRTPGPPHPPTSSESETDASQDRDLSGEQRPDEAGNGSADAGEGSSLSLDLLPGTAADGTDGGWVPVPGSGRRRRVLAGVIAAGGVGLIAGLLAVLLQGTGAASPRQDGAPAVASSASSFAGLCAYVTKGPAWIYDAPDTSAAKLREKPIDSGITVLDRPHPPGWTAVFTPYDQPKYKWMQTADLSAPYDGPHPCPDHK